MRAVSLPSPIDVRDYAKALGWRLRDAGNQYRQYVMDNPEYPRRQLVFPMDSTAPDLQDAIGTVVEKLADLYAKDMDSIVGEITSAKADTLRFQVSAARAAAGSLPLPYAVNLVSGAQQLLLASACTVLKPQVRHPRLSRTEAQKLIEASRFGHTEDGSFVLKVSCPVAALDIQAPLQLEDEEGPFVRRTVLTIEKALSQLVGAIETDSIDNLLRQTIDSDRPLLSSNLCEALTRFYDESLENSLDISIAWAPTLLPALGKRKSTFRIQNDYFSKIGDIGQELRSSEEGYVDTFIGTVESLEGELNDLGRREGDVTLKLIFEEELIRASVSLDAERYVQADRAHMTNGAVVRIRGKLNPGRQPRWLTDVTAFELIEPIQAQPS